MARLSDRLTGVEARLTGVDKCLAELQDNVKNNYEAEGALAFGARLAGVSGLLVFLTAWSAPWFAVLAGGGRITQVEVQPIEHLWPEIPVLLLAGFGAMPLVASAYRYFTTGFNWGGEFGVLVTLGLVAFGSAGNTLLITGLPLGQSWGWITGWAVVGWLLFGGLRWQDRGVRRWMGHPGRLVWDTSGSSLPADGLSNG